MYCKQSDEELRLREDDLIFIDFDGTISTIDTGIAMIDTLDGDEAWELEWRWRRGEIDSMQCMEGQWGLWKRSAVELYEFIDSLEIDPAFDSLVRGVMRAGAGLVVVSDGLDFYVDRMLAKIGWQTCPGERVIERPGKCIPRFANHAEVSDEGVVLSFPHRDPECSDCGNCKTAHLKRLRKHFTRIFYIGDGHSDLCGAPYADVVFAKEALAEHLEKQKCPFHRFSTLQDVCDVLLSPPES